MEKVKKIKAIIFDCGGVLHTNIGQYTEEDITVTLGVTGEQYKKACAELMPDFQTGKIDENEFWKRFIAITNAANPLPSQSLWGREFKRRYKVLVDVLQLVEKLKAKGMKVALLSNTIATHAKINQQMGVYAPFETIILSYEVGLAKPDPKIYQLMLSQLGTAAQQSVFVDDKQENIDAALKLRIKGILFQNTQQLIGDLQKVGVET